MWEEIVFMFTNMQWYIYVPLIIGVVLLIIECFVPGFGVFGISGLVVLAGSIIAQGVLHQSVAQVLFLASIAIVIVFILFLIFIRSARFGLISKSPFIEKRTAVSADYNDKNKNELKYLLGKKGVSITSMKPTGKFLIDDKQYEGITAGEPIEKGDIIKVIDVEGVKIKVERVEV